MLSSVERVKVHRRSRQLFLRDVAIIEKKSKKSPAQKRKIPEFFYPLKHIDDLPTRVRFIY